MKELVPLIALVLSVISLGWQTFTWRKQQWQSRLSTNLGILAETKLKLSEIPEAIRFHGITQEEMKSHGVNGRELSYLVANFMAGQAFYVDEESNRNTPFPKGDYREQMCKTESLQRAWPLVSRMLDDTPYKRRVEVTINKYTKSS